MIEKNALILILLLGFSQTGFGQDKVEDKTDPDSSGLVNDVLLPTSTPVLLFTALEDKEDSKKERKKKKKNKKKRIYFGQKTQRSMIKQTFREQTQTQLFHYTTGNQNVDPYIRDIYWYDRKERVIRTKGFDPSSGYLLHGPYEKRIGDAVVESGMFYYGTKHGRWMSYNTQNILLDKSHFYEGWPKASRLTYYNRAEKQIEKIIPVEYELEEGNFYHFYENGQVAVIGEYKYGEKVGIWTQYWENAGDSMLRKREIQYQEDPFTKGFRPFIRAEWDREGNLVYRRDA